MKSMIKRLSVLTALLTFAITVPVYAQIDGGDLTNDILNQVGDGGAPGAAPGGLGGGAPTGGLGSNVGDREQALIVPDERQTSGFVGSSVSAERGENFTGQEFRFVGPIATGDGAGGAGGGNRNVGGNLGGAAGATSTNRVQRATPVRARLVPRFRAPRVAPAAVSTRVNQRLSSLPATRRFAGSMNVSVQGRTAVINSRGLSTQQMSRVSRQLRLEPGIRRVVTSNSFGR